MKEDVLRKTCPIIVLSLEGLSYWRMCFIGDHVLRVDMTHWKTSHQTTFLKGKKHVLL